MPIRLPALVRIVGAPLALSALAACGSHGAPPYAPETPRAASPAAAAGVSPAAARAVPSDPHAVYDLREKCGADAREWYQHVAAESGVSPPQATANHGYTSHYNMKSNDCFALTTSVSRGVEVQKLADVLENREIGMFSQQTVSAAPTQCHVAAAVCTSREEWQALTAKYMND